MAGPSSSLLPLFQTLVEIVRDLRGPDGCPWDKEQTQTSLTQYAIEEAYELAEAIESGDQNEVREELGDFLFQVILQAQVAADLGHFTLEDVLRSLNEKMIRRHPHVFGEARFANVAEVWKNWDQIKKQEKLNKPGGSSIFNIPRGLPALQTAAKIGRKTEGWKFDWTEPEQVIEKIREELEETEDALSRFRADHPGERFHPQSAGREALDHEIGDLLFSTAQLARHVGLDPEASLREANRRFIRRFENVVARAGVDKETFARLPDPQKEELWRKAKRDEADAKK